MSGNSNDLSPKPQNSESNVDYIDPSFLKIKNKSAFLSKLDALKRVPFVRPIGSGEQHLDIGCGWGNFTKHALLPRMGPSGRIIGVDRADHLLDYARKHASHPSVTYEHLDIEEDDPQPLLDKYGQFDRIFSFVTLQCVRDLERAYRNVFRLLKDGGECVFLTLTGSVITDVMYHLSSMEPWKAYVPDPKKLYSDRVFFGTPIVAEKVVEAEKKALEGAGLALLFSSVYDAQWMLPNVQLWMDQYISMFKLDANIPEEKRDAFRTVCRNLLEERTLTTDEGCSMRHSFVIVHAQKPPRN